ncbi:hypothetical protein JAAARDRAFT_38390 [Jaapia argillacea MUCL 33604]|uniref:Uncharacterized protein n=1 Tax=Jaapia argillacea MUCL 33604 TaxID=933084 RepID=A0A067PK53_9AGAM|nr:hypothetical protein JAAARDRAFT_38390 [Jaapia argillacea MUCL 33604]
MLDPGYAITRPYPWPRFGPIFLVVSCIVLIVLTLLNVAVAGYETVTVTRIDKNVTQQMWWTPFIPRAFRATTTCDSSVLNVGDTFMTNNSIFQWTVLGASLGDPLQGGAYENGGFPYSAAPMSSCDSAAGSTEIHVDVNVATVTVVSILACDIGTRMSVLIQATWQWNPNSRGYWLMSLLSGPVFDVLLRLSQDLLEAFLTSPPPGTEAILRLGVIGNPYCPSFQDSNGTVLFQPSQEDELQCAREPRSVGFQLRAVSWTNGSSSYEPDNDGLDYTTPALRNLLQAAMAAAEIDLGIYKENSIYFDMEMFNATIEPNPLLTGSHFVGRPGDGNLSNPYIISSSTANNLSGAQILRMYPVPPLYPVALPLNRSFQLPAIIEVSYLCHDLRIKSPLAFMSSVFVGTISMFMAFRSIVLLIATVLAKRYSERANYCEGSLALDEGISLVESRHVQAAVPPIMVTQNNAMLEMETFHDRTESEVTLSAQPATSHLAKDDGARVYDTQDNYQWSSELRALLGKTPEET